MPLKLACEHVAAIRKLKTIDVEWNSPKEAKHTGVKQINAIVKSFGDCFYQATRDQNRPIRLTVRWTCTAFGNMASKTDNAHLARLNT